MRWIAVVVMSLSVAGLPVHAQSPLSGAADAAASAFMTELRRAVAASDRHAVAALVRFPIVVTIGGVRVPLDNDDAFAERFDAVFTPALKGAVARTDRDPQSISITAERLVVGNDLIVAARRGGLWRIDQITVPPPRAPDAGNEEPRRISVRAGPYPTQMAGALAGGATDAYVVGASKGQLLEVRIEGVRGRDIVARVFNLATGEPLDARAKEGVRTWSGRVTASGEYRIDVVRLKPGTDALPYTLSVRTR